MRRLILLALASLSLWATAPTITDGPTVIETGPGWVYVKARLADGTGCASQLNGSITTSTTTFSVDDTTCFAVGRVANVDQEHMRVTARSVSSGAGTITVQRNYDTDVWQVGEGSLVSIAASSATCTATTAYPHRTPVGANFSQFMRGAALGAGGTWTVATTPTDTTFTFTCTGATNGTYSNAGLQLTRAAQSHADNAAITLISHHSLLCLGTSTGVYTESFAPHVALSTLVPSVNVWIPGIQLLENTHYYGTIMATYHGDGSTSCTSPGMDTTISSEFEFDTTASSDTTAQPSTDVITFYLSLLGDITWSTDVEAMSDGSDVQDLIDDACAADGDLNHRIRVPVSALRSDNLEACAKGGPNPSGTGLLWIEPSGAATCLPPKTIYFNPEIDAACVPTFYSSTANIQTLRVMPSSHHWVVRGLKLSTNPDDFDLDTTVVSSFTGDDADYDVAQDPHHIALLQNWIEPPAQDNDAKGIRLHGDFIVVANNHVVGYADGTDLGAIQVDGSDSDNVLIHNNTARGAMSAIFVSDNGYRQSDVIIRRNRLEKPTSWHRRNPDWISRVAQDVSAIAAGATTAIDTDLENNIQTNDVVSFGGGTGDWAALNRTIWRVADGDVQVTVASGTATWDFAAAHGLTTGDRIAIYGMYGFGSCANLRAASVVITVTDPDTLTHSTTASDFSTQTGTTQCAFQDPTVIGPVFVWTRSDADTGSVALTSTGFGAYGGSGITVYYPLSMNQKNILEFKQCRTCLIEGNVFTGGPSVFQPNGGIVMSVRGPGSGGIGYPQAQGNSTQHVDANYSIRDTTIRYNFMRDACVMLGVLGLDVNGPSTPLTGLRVEHNVAAGISSNHTSNDGCSGAAAYLNSSYYDLSMLHNTVINAGVVIQDSYQSSMARSGYIFLRDSIYYSRSGMNNEVCFWGGMVVGLGCASDARSWRGWDVSRNIFFGNPNDPGGDPWGFQRQYMSGVTDGLEADYLANFWPNGQGDVGWSGALSITTCTNAIPIRCTFSTAHGAADGDQIQIRGVTGLTNALGQHYVKVVDADELDLVGTLGNGTFGGTATAIPFSGAWAVPSKYRLAASSVYDAGTSYVAPAGPPSYGTAGSGEASDTGDVGADIDAELEALGWLDFTSATPDDTSVTLAYTQWAGTGETCYGQVSDDSGATWTALEADDSMGTSRSLPITGLTAETAYLYRLRCPSFSADGSFMTTEAGEPPVTPAGVRARGNVQVRGQVRRF